MKKRIVSITLVVMVLLTSSAFAYTDVPSYDAGFEAIKMVTNLGLMDGFEDGSFRPDDTLTRAELAKITVIAMDLYPEEGETIFNDVSEDYWAAGWINRAYIEGVINGRGDGSFYPDDPATYEEAVKMIVCALGYEPEAMTKTGWPVGYLAIASVNKITTGAEGTRGTPITRRQFAMLLNNALHVPIFDNRYWDPRVFYSSNEGETLMSRMINRMNRDAEE